MNKNIKIMIELQRYWSAILSAEASILKKQETIKFWQNELIQKEEYLSSLTESIKKLKSEIKEKDLHLNELDEKADKLEKRKSVISTEREMTALSKELLVINEERNDLEEKLIGLMDELGEKQKHLEKTDMEYVSMTEQVRRDISQINDDIASQELLKNQNKEKFENLLTALDAAFLSKFQKLLSSKNGIAIAEINNEICGACNFKIPSSLAIDAAKDEKISSCTNCGRFIYQLRQ